MSFVPPKLVPNAVVVRLRELGASAIDIANRTERSRENVRAWIYGYYQPKPDRQKILNAMLVEYETNADTRRKLQSLQRDFDKIAKN